MIAQKSNRLQLVSLFCLAAGAILFSGVAQSLCIKGDMAHLRKGPGTKFAKSWTVGKYTPFEKLKRKGSWIQVRDVDEETHWIHSSLVTYQYSCLTVTRSVAMLRTGPGKRYKLASMRQADRYTSFKKLDREGHWFKIEDSRGEISWIHDSSVWRPLKAIEISF